MRSRVARPAAGIAACTLIAALFPLAARAADAPAADVTGLLTLPRADAIADLKAPVLRLTDALRPAARGIRVAVISSGVDTRALPEDLRSRITPLGSAQDPAGYGTYVTSVLLQLDPDAVVTSIGVYPGGRFNPDWQAGALDWTVKHASELDAVLYAVPPHEFLDPVSATMSAGAWGRVLDAAADNPVPGREGPVLGIPLDPSVRRAQTAKAGDADRKAIDSFASLTSRWQAARAQVRALGDAGVPFVVPAGDLGPSVQTIFGLGNLPEAITVGGWDGKRVSPRSASGPSIDGSVKPDLVAPTGFVGVLPERSTLAKTLADQKLLDAGLVPAWGTGEAPSKARARLDTSMSAATLVAAAAGGMHKEGITDVARQRGALSAAAVPVRGEAVWRQGAGVLRLAPHAAFASSRPLALSAASLGAEPDAGAWAASVPFSGGAPARAVLALTSFAGVEAGGRTVTRDVKPSQAPSASVGAGPDGVRISVPLDQSRYEGGVYCGYTDVSVIGTSGDVRPGVTVEGVPSGTEQLPTCLVKGSRLRAFGFYIHDLPAENLTFSLLPALPEEASLLEKPLMFLPVDPTRTKLYTKVTGPDGYATFSNVPPGYYRVRQFSDYGSPITQRLISSSTGADVVRHSDIGENPSYESFDALVLSATAWTEQDLRNTFGSENVKAEKPTGAYLVTIGPRTIRVVLGFLKKMPGPAVSSRVVDLLSYDDLDFGSLPLGAVFDLAGLGALEPSGKAQGWTFTRGASDPQRVVGAFNPAATNADLLGAGTYPFDLTTPNYKAHMSLNFSYELTNAYIVAVVQMGEEAAVGVVTPQGTLRAPTVGGQLGRGGVAFSGQANGLASFDFELKPKGASHGTLTFLFVPSKAVQAVAAPLSSASIADMSFELDTWQRVQWPAQMTPRGQGHAFEVKPNYSQRQMSAPGCRTIDSGGVRAGVCEDWQVMVHSPGDDAETVDVVTSSGSIAPDLRSNGSRFADPRRGTADFSQTLAFTAPAAGGLVTLDASVPHAFKTNGRFWEQLALTKATLRDRPGPVRFDIVDNLVGRSGGLVPHADGGVPVPPYVPFAAEAVVVGGNDLSMADADRDGVPLLTIDVASPAAAGATSQLLRLGDPDDADPSVPGSGGSLQAAVITDGALTPLTSITVVGASVNAAPVPPGSEAAARGAEASVPVPAVPVPADAAAQTRKAQGASMTKAPPPTGGGAIKVKAGRR